MFLPVSGLSIRIIIAIAIPKSNSRPQMKMTKKCLVFFLIIKKVTYRIDLTKNQYLNNLGFLYSCGLLDGGITIFNFSSFKPFILCST